MKFIFQLFLRTETWLLLSTLGFIMVIIIIISQNHEIVSSFLAYNYTEHGYVVRSQLCQIPHVNPYHESIKKFIKRWKPHNCSKSKKNALTTVTYDFTSHMRTIKLHTPALKEYSVAYRDVQCCYSVLTREVIHYRHHDHDDDRFSISAPVCYGQKTVLPPQIEYIYVNCSSKKLSYKNIHSMVIEKQNTHPKQDTDSVKYSVLLFGIDSVSRLNMIRSMPKTVEYLKNKQWLELEGYNKIAENTFPNLMAVLTGMNVYQSKQSFSKSMLDDFPFIWKNFKNNSYVTAYIEDCPQYGTFNYRKYGFMNSPTDYYTRPYLTGAEKFLENDGGMSYCLGMFPVVEYLFQYVTEFTKRFHQRSFFNLFWTNSFSHDDLNMPTVMDRRVKTFLEDIENYLNSTIVIFFSDHGMRWGGIRETFVGWLEERMPFLYFWIPPSFKSTFPEKYANLLANKNRLSSPYDLYATLQDILYGEVITKPVGCPSCDTLFKKIPWDRSCENASIPEHWCACHSGFEPVSFQDPDIRKKAVAVVARINEYFRDNRHSVSKGKRCAVLSLHKILGAHRKLKSESFETAFAVKPSGAIFEVTYETDFKVDYSVSRINTYGKESSCVIFNANLEKYCFCLEDTTDT